MTREVLLNAYIDANIILIMGALVWALTQFVLAYPSIRTSFGAQLRLLYGLMIAVGFAPIAFILAWPHVLASFPGNAAAFNLSDIIIAQYLDGRFNMAPTRFEDLLMIRHTLVLDVTTFGSIVGTGVAFALLAGVALSLLKTLKSVIRVRRIIRVSYPWRKFGRLEIRLTDASHVPFSTRGLRRYYIMVPSGMLSNYNDLRIAVAHELQHIRQGDLEWELVLESLRPLFFFNPAFGMLKRNVERLRELACDQRLLSSHRVTAQEYCACLVRVCQNALRRDAYKQIEIPTVALVQVDGFHHGSRSEMLLRQRVRMMMRGVRSRRHDWLTLALIIPLTCAIGFSAVSVQRNGDWSQDRLMLSTIVNLERLNNRNAAN